ncbi:glutamine--fructose-6-phosphate transaminase (isomerizing), partial [Rhodovulum bhavnagarense]|uniref:glutamine--fructose-6-phosphate transaminase (isomerizing) n=1 Tax=Rhodovulum bhavnagarense TaxID=992286 RepID=UPI001049ECCE
AIGWGEGEMFVGSDAIALAPLTNRITYLEEGDRAVITRAGAQIRDGAGRPVMRPVKTVEIDLARAEKGGHKHFMAKEIAEQPTVMGEALRHYITDDGRQLVLPGGGIDFSGIGRITMVACGTAYLACLTAKYWIEQLAGLPVDVDVASEFRYREPPIPEGTLALFVSQSGETADTLAALRYCRGRAARIVSVVNVPESTMARESDLVLPILAGPEIGVASTKAFTCQLAVLALCALEAACQRGRLDGDGLARRLDQLTILPGRLNAALALEGDIARVALSLAEADDVLFLGRGAMFPLALEGALKLKEISYIHAEGYASGELKHGPIALVDKTVPVIVLAPHDRLFDKTVSNMQEVMAR